MSAVSVAVGVGCEAAWCSQICEDVENSYQCKCVAGYRLADDGRSCVAADGKSHVFLLDSYNLSPYDQFFAFVIVCVCHLP